jgi:hypothetical protein
MTEVEQQLASEASGRSGYLFLSEDISKYKVDKNGYLRIKACIFKEGVYKAPFRIRNGEPKEMRNVLYSLSEFADSESLTRLQSVPVIAGHEDIDSKNASRHKIGHIAGMPVLEKGAIFVDLIIDDEDAKAKILRKELHDISLSYTCISQESPGIRDGIEYDGIQTHISFNHIGLLPRGAGRMGPEVKVFNSREEADETKEQHFKKNNERSRLMAENAKDDKDGVLAKILEKVDDLTAKISGKDGDQKSDSSEKLLAEVKELKNEVKELKAGVAKSEEPKAGEAASEEAVDRAVSESIEDNKLAETVDTVCNSKLANTGLHGNKLYDACLKQCGVDPATVSSKKETFRTLVSGMRMVSQTSEAAPIKIYNSLEREESPPGFLGKEDLILHKARISVKKEKRNDVQ